MRKTLLGLGLVMAVLAGAEFGSRVAPGLDAQSSPQQAVSFGSVTYDATVGGVPIPPALLTVNGAQVRECSGVLETGTIRYRTDPSSTAVSATVGRPVAVGEAVTIAGYTRLSRFRGIRQTATSGVIQWECRR